MPFILLNILLMKTFSFKNFLSLPFIALIAVIFLGVASQALADDAYYTGNYTPATCDANLMSVSYLTPTFIGGDLTGNTIYVFAQGTYLISNAIQLSGDCITLVNSGTAILSFQNGKYISLYEKNNIWIDGISINANLNSQYGILAYTAG